MVLNIHKVIKDKWESAPSQFRHNEIPKWIGTLDDMNKDYEKLIKPLHYEGKTIIDYGCGGAWLAKLIAPRVKRYIGFDISEKSIEYAKSNIAENCKLVLVTDFIDFKKYKADIFFCLATLIHSPNQEYFDELLKRINESGCSELMLHYKEGKLRFFEATTFAAWVPREYIDERLTNYKNIGRITDEENVCNYYERNA